MSTLDVPYLCAVLVGCGWPTVSFPRIAVRLRLELSRVLGAKIIITGPWAYRRFVVPRALGSPSVSEINN